MTSNIGSRQLQDFGSGLGFMTTSRESQQEELQKDVTKDRYKYYFGQYNVEVCRKTFIQTLDISVGRLTSINKRKSETGDITPDKRGKRE